MDGVDKGEGIDNGAESAPSTAEFERCATQADCTRGSCIQAERSRPGVCVAICAAPFAGSGSELGSFRVEPCLRTEQCVLFSGGAGLCLRPCSTSAECPTNTRCGPLDAKILGLFCVPVFAGSSTVDEPPTESAPAPR